MTRERDDPSLNKLFSFPRIKGRKGRGGCWIGTENKTSELQEKPPLCSLHEQPLSLPLSSPALSQGFYSQSLNVIIIIISLLAFLFFFFYKQPLLKLHRGSQDSS